LAELLFHGNPICFPCLLACELLINTPIGSNNPLK
jgi:hypothetical protein